MPCGTSGWQRFTGYSGAYLSDGTYMEGIRSNDTKQAGETGTKRQLKYLDGASLRYDPSLYRRLFYNVTQSLFQGNLLEHIGYEMRLQRYIRATFNRRYKLYDKDVKNTQIYSMNDLKERMVSLQKEYEKEIKEAAGDEVLCFQTDLEYMNIAVQTVAGYLIPALNRKSILYCKIENGTLVRISPGCRI